MKIIFSAVTDKGLKRQTNQDSIFAQTSDDESVALFVIADGMGGHYMGELASERITSGFESWWASFADCNFEQSYEECIEGINDVIFDANCFIFDNYTGVGNTCGSTVVILFIYKDRYYIMNIGDSRLYEYRKKSLNQISFDHTLGAVYLKMGKITEQEINSNRRYAKLVEAVGCKKKYNSFVEEGTLTNTRFILCTDGLYKYIPKAKLLKHTRSRRSPDRLTAELMKDVFLAGAKDNVSIIIADIYCNNSGKSKNGKGTGMNSIVSFSIILAVFILILLLILGIILL